MNVCKFKVSKILATYLESNSTNLLMNFMMAIDMLFDLSEVNCWTNG
jgi:hypothetical protein